MKHRMHHGVHQHDPAVKSQQMQEAHKPPTKSFLRRIAMEDGANPGSSPTNRCFYCGVRFLLSYVRLCKTTIFKDDEWACKDCKSELNLVEA